MFQLQNQVIENRTIELAGKEHQYLGHNLTVIGCRLIVRVSASAFTIAKTRLLDCDIEVKKQLNNFPWFGAYLEGCRFTGKLRGNDFGYWPEQYPDDGGISACDFRGAELDGCRFFGCDVQTMQFPRWPCFTFLDPGRRKEELAAAPWPGRVGMAMVFEHNPAAAAAISWSATTLAKKFGATEDEIRAVLETLTDVVY